MAASSAKVPRGSATDYATLNKSTPSSLSPSSYPDGLQPLKNFIEPKVAVIERIWANQNAQSQDFYGRAIDQFGKPVVGAIVTGTLMQIQGVDEASKKEYYSRQSDSNGDFEFVGLHGWQLGVVVKKEGFELGQAAGVYQSPNRDDKTSPTERAIFHMWKLKGPERMSRVRIHSYIPCDGSAVTFDLLTGMEVKYGGDLKVSLKRIPVDIVRGQPFDWQLTLQVPGGGLQAIKDLYPNEAPSEGYEQSVVINMTVGTSNWSPTYRHDYYFLTGNGKDYGRISIDFTGDFEPPPTFFGGDIYVNRSGSRNLEFDANNQD